ncbi:hypothetical protein FRB99_008445 [Tulasnella sp. 403]|nr:hypothetical protein FRB99_008445 [Tulasnella sp. 403]
MLPIIDQAPTLWTSIPPDADPRLISKVISKSGNCPLFINREEFLFGTSLSSRSFLQQLCPQVHRWKTASFTLQAKGMQYLQECLTNSFAPQLEELHLIVRVGDRVRVDLFRGGVGRLKKLDLMGLSIPWTSPLLSHLQVLRLTGVGDSTGPTTIHILTVLAQCPELLELRIVDCNIRDVAAPNLPSRLELPHLRILSFHHKAISIPQFSVHLAMSLLTPVSPLAPFAILSRISTPKYDYFHLISEFKNDLRRDNPLEKISNIRPSLAHLVASARHIEIKIDEVCCQYSAHSGEPVAPLKLCITHPSPFAVLGWITGVFCDAMKTVPSEVVISSTLPEHGLSAIGRVSSTTTLELRGAQTPIIRYLSTTTLIDGKRRWPLPELATLTIDEDDNDPDEILRMVESRYGLTTKYTHLGSKTQLPVPFESLVIDGMGTTLSRDTYRRIREIVGGDCFEAISMGWDEEDDEEDDDDDDDTSTSYGGQLMTLDWNH